ncbi:antitoxin [Kumtagia ephedrae]|jgi:antitoxin VapB|uniref:AbrB/MazE/SpoVT family DNA-binding domain-containing protein n=1 Tax=Kumtagia ephedrae TaxID=2116701 RepID=A0A2P7SLN1_9HYPH|nr:AbrB/MazE/SpoVT family DNA-binding domain-containing protein [Mesorhizobium ephedrae]PSJ63404.1 AbrB/MazE/SpoVT family DNA-binding domain-containing protein [Mesorhizobium ephedrae]
MLNKPKTEQRARVFRNGRSRAIRIPKEFEFEGDEVTIRKEADGSLTVIPDRRERSPKEIIEWLRQQPKLTEDDFPDIDDSDMLPLDDIKL